MTGHTLPAGLEPLAGAFARVGAIAYNAVLAGDIHLGEDVAVFGQGVIGLLATRLAQLNGARVTAVDALDGRLETAKRYGAHHTLNARTDAVAERIREATAGLGADLAIEISGAYPALHDALRSVAVGGRVVASGFYQGDGIGLRLGTSSTTTAFSSSAPRSAASHRSCPTAGASSAFSRPSSGWSPRGRSTSPPWSATSSRPPTRADAYVLLDERPAEALQVVLEF